MAWVDGTSVITAEWLNSVDADIVSLEGETTTNASDISTNASDISDNTAELATKLSDITGESIKDLLDVFSTMAPTDGQVLTYDTTNGWQSEDATGGVTDHTLLTNIGTNTHAQVDTHVADSTIHFTEASISITESQISDLQAYLLDITGESIKDLSDVYSTMSPIDGQVLTYDTTNGWQSETSPTGVTDHTLLSNIGTNTHAQLDTHVADSTVHFTEASISLTESQISDLQAYLLNITGESIKDLSDVYSSMAPTDGQVLTYDTTNGWQAETGGGGGGLDNVVEDLTPQLGGNLDVNGKSIVSVSDGDIMLAADGTGLIDVRSDIQVSSADGTNTSLTIWNDNDISSHPDIDITSNGMISVENSLYINVAATTAGTLKVGYGSKTNDATYVFEVGESVFQYNGNDILTSVKSDLTPQLGGNLDVNGKHIVSVSNGNVTLTPDGTGVIDLRGDVQINNTDGTQVPITFWNTNSMAVNPDIELLDNGVISAENSLYLNVAASAAGTLKVGYGARTNAATYVFEVGESVFQYYGNDILTTTTGLSNVVEDTTPQLGGNLDVNGKSIVSASNGDITLAPDGTGQVLVGDSSGFTQVELFAVNGTVQCGSIDGNLGTAGRFDVSQNIGSTTGPSIQMFGSTYSTIANREGSMILWGATMQSAGSRSVLRVGNYNGSGWDDLFFAYDDGTVTIPKKYTKTHIGDTSNTSQVVSTSYLKSMVDYTARGQITITAASTYTLAAGIWTIVDTSGDVYLELYGGGSWLRAASSGGIGSVVSDGTNVRLYNSGAGDRSFGYLKQGLQR